MDEQIKNTPTAGPEDWGPVLNDWGAVDLSEKADRMRTYIDIAEACLKMLEDKSTKAQAQDKTRPDYQEFIKAVKDLLGKSRDIADALDDLADELIGPSPCNTDCLAYARGTCPFTDKSDCPKYRDIRK